MKMGDMSRDKATGGCGILNAVFGKNKLWPRRSASAGAVPSKASSNASDNLAPIPNVRVARAPTPAKACQQQQKQQLGMARAVHASQGKKKQAAKATVGISGELENLIAEQQRGRGGNAGLVRASSGNVMLYGHLGNLKQPATHSREEAPKRYGNSVMGNIVKNNSSSSLCRAISCRMDPEELKILGNEDYKNGRFAEALALYERAIDIDPSKASYRSNKSAALTALGRLLEAVFECRRAIQIDPHYHRAHHRLANLHLRLGEPEKALHHFKEAGPEADPDAMAKARAALSHLSRCDQAKRIRDWNAVLRATDSAISAGADSAPTVFALQAEAFLRLHRHQDADAALRNSPCFDIQQSTEFFGPAGNAALLLIRAQVDMACGRFEDAMAAAERAAQVDPSNREVNPIRRRARCIASARAHGNQLFKASKFSEASAAYSEGLEHDPYNSVLLCNRAACRSKLGHFDKAIEDCNAALRVRPSYSKATLRRADCNSKLGKWAAAIQDYEMLTRESPADEEVGRALFEARMQLKRQQGEDQTLCNEVIVVQSNERFRHFISLPGLAVVLFCDKPGLGFMEQLCKRYPTIKFLKVEAEEVALIARSQGVTSFPAFNIYKDGAREKEVAGDDHQLLETSIKDYVRRIE